MKALCFSCTQEGKSNVWISDALALLINTHAPTGCQLRPLLRKTTSSQCHPLLSSYQKGKVSSQPGKCINQDLQDPNQIKWMITTEVGRKGKHTKRGESAARLLRQHALNLMQLERYQEWANLLCPLLKPVKEDQILASTQSKKKKKHQSKTSKPLLLPLSGEKIKLFHIHTAL